MHVNVDLPMYMQNNAGLCTEQSLAMHILAVACNMHMGRLVNVV